MSVAGKRTWGGLVGLALAAATLVAILDLVVSQILPPPRFPEVEDGVAQFAAGDPTVLVLGSSHLRTFEHVGSELARRTDGQGRLVAVPVDWGKASSYRWTWEHRLRPLLDETDASGAPRHPSLRHVILVTQWWDFRTLGPGDDPLVNLPARSWTFGDWLADVWANGVTPYNQNYVLHRWSRLFAGSVLVQFRGRTAILDRIKSTFRPEAEAAALGERYRDRLRYFRQYVERGGELLFDPEDVDAFDALVREWKGRGLDVTVVLYPRMHGMVTEKALVSPIGLFSSWMAGNCRDRDVRLVDLSWEHPLSDADFGVDLDHPTDDANRRFASWALDGVLRFLVDGDAPEGEPRGGTP